VLRADICRLSRNLGASTSWNPLGLSRPVTGLLYLYSPKVAYDTGCGSGLVLSFALTARPSGRSGYRLVDARIGFRFLVGENCFSLRYGIQKGPGDDTACYPAGNGDLSTRVKGPDRETNHY
jgi:hypothetical protein